MTTRLTSLVVACLITTVVPIAQAATGYGLWDCYMIPGAAHLPGEFGTFWQTDVAILNPHSYKAITVDAWFLEELRDNSEAESIPLLVPANSQLLVSDVVAARFGAEGKGTLLLCSRDEDFFTATARTYTGSVGTFGQTINGQKNVNRTGDSAFLAGLRGSPPYRTNIGVVNWSSVPISVVATVYDASGALRGSRGFSLLPFSSEQVAMASFATGFVSGYARLTSVVVPAGGWWLAYASVVDNNSGDAVFVEERADDVFTSRRPSYDLGGEWWGTIASPLGSQSIVANIYQDEAWVRVYAYDTTTGAYLAYLEGYEEYGQVVFTGSCRLFGYLGDEVWGSASVQSGGWGLSGTFDGEGYFVYGGAFSLSKASSWSTDTATALDPTPRCPPRRSQSSASRPGHPGE